MTLDNSTIASLNGVTDEPLLVAAVDIFVPGNGSAYIVNNTDDIVFNNNTYTALPFVLSDISQETASTVPSYQIKIDNTARIFEQYLMDYDNYIKIHGIANNILTCIIRIIQVSYLDDGTVTCREVIEPISCRLNQPSCDAVWATFNLGAISPYGMPYPPKRMYAEFCQSKFLSPACGVENITSIVGGTVLDSNKVALILGYGVRIGSLAISNLSTYTASMVPYYTKTLNEAIYGLPDGVLKTYLQAVKNNTYANISCDKTLTSCRNYNNSGRFMAFAGIGKGVKL